MAISHDNRRSNLYNISAGKTLKFKCLVLYDNKENATVEVEVSVKFIN